jgi:succinate dehydrogenase / fumarate reductase cytochrome b subunit
MRLTSGYFTTSIGKKLVVAITGFLVLAFVIAHMAGNLQIYAGPEKINAYAKFLKDLGPLLWVARIGLLVVVALHVIFTLQLARQNRLARPEGYKYMKTVQASSGSRFMVLSGLTILAFLVYHLLHFTLGVTHPEYLSLEYDLNGDRVHDVYAMVVIGFQKPLISGFYILSMGLLCWHLSHGVSSLFQTLGLASPKQEPRIKSLGYALAGIIFVGNVSIPVSILLGVVK